MSGDPVTDLGSKYDIRQQIGKGSFGSAFLVTNKLDKKDYVLKRVRLAKQTRWQRSSTLQERDLVTSLLHPFVVPCVETWIVQGHTVNMVYGYCEKGDLASYLQQVLKARSQVDEGQMVRWLCQLLLALDYLQTKKVLHRDIKTSNLMLTNDYDVQIGDFGLATRMQDKGEGSKPQDTNLVGTPHYMSPELLSCKDYGFKTDVWSLGCVFYELTAQRPTFNAFNIHGLVSKIKKNKLAPLPDTYSAEWREVVELMLLKNPDKRPSVQELMALPCLRPGILQARKRAQQLIPEVQLPPLFDPTPFVVRQSVSMTNDMDSDSSAAVSEAGVSEVLDVVHANREYGGVDSSSSSTTRGTLPLTTQAVGEDELSKVWRMNSTQPDSAQQQQQTAPQLHVQAQEQQQQYPDPGHDWQLVDTISSRCSDSSHASSSSPGSLRMLPTPKSGLGSPGKQAVYQPGIKLTRAERVAAAIAAARSGKAASAGADDVAGLGTSAIDYHSTATDAVRAEVGTSNTQCSTSSKSESSSTDNALAAPQSARQEARAALSARLAAYKDSKQVGASNGGRLGSRVSSAKGNTPSSSRPAWNAGAANNVLSPIVAGMTRQRSSNGRIPGTASTLKAAAAALTPTAKDKVNGYSSRSVQHQPRPSSKKPGGAYLQSLQDRQQHQAHKQNEAKDSVQLMPSKSQQLSMQVTTAEPDGPEPQQAASLEAQQQPQQQDTPVSAVGGISGYDSDSEDCESAVKQLQFDSTPLRSHNRASKWPRSATLVAHGAAAPDVMAAATAAAQRHTAARLGRNEAEAAAADESPVLWATAGASTVTGQTTAVEPQQQQGTPPLHSSITSPTDSSQNSMLHGGVKHGAADGDSLLSGKAAADHVALDATERQRLQLLESVLLVVGGLYAKGRWQELGNVLSSAGLLPDRMHTGIRSAARQTLPSSPSVSPGTQAGTLQHGSNMHEHGNGVQAARNQQQQQSVLEVGDIVVLGRTKRVRGRIRYVGPVAWDVSGEDWVGMELESPCGMSGTQKGITYFECPPKCATFHKASQLTSFDGTS